MTRPVPLPITFLTSSLLVTLVTAGCTGSASDGARPEPAPATPATSDVVATPPAAPARPFRAAPRRLPAGWTRARCSDLRSRGSRLAVSLAVPPGYAAVSRDDTTCGFAAGFGREFYVSFDVRTSLRSEKQRELDPREDVGGDDSVSDIDYAAQVPVFGRRRGERLSYHCYCDGQDLDELRVQTHGVRLSWTTPHGRSSRPAAYRAVTRSLALARGATSTCISRGRTVVFRPPIPQTESIDFGRHRCHLYLRPGRGSLLRYAEIAARPRPSLEVLAARLQARPNVTGVRLDHGAGRLAGEPADRLTWTVTRRHQTQDYQPAGTWRAVALAIPRLRVIWSATPRQWRTERKAAAAFFRSVR